MTKNRERAGKPDRNPLKDKPDKVDNLSELFEKTLNDGHRITVERFLAHHRSDLSSQQRKEIQEFVRERIRRFEDEINSEEKKEGE